MQTTIATCKIYLKIETYHNWVWHLCNLFMLGVCKALMFIRVVYDKVEYNWQVRQEKKVKIKGSACLNW